MREMHILSRVGVLLFFSITTTSTAFEVQANTLNLEDLDDGLITSGNNS